MKNLLYIFSLIILFASCKKEPLPELPPENGPYYSIKGYIDGEFIDLNVGQEGNHISQGSTITNGIKTYYGQLVSPSEDLLIRMEFLKPRKPYKAEGFDAFELSNLGYLVHEPGCMTFGFGNNQMQASNISIQDQTGNYNSVNEFELSEYGIFDVKMKFTDVGSDTYEVPVNYGFKNSLITASFYSASNGDTTVLTAVDQELSHKWLIDDQEVGTDSEVSQVLSDGIHKVEHQVTDDLGNQESYTTLIRITNNTLDWQMTMNPCGSSNSPDHQYGKVTVVVTKNGEEFKSVNAPENLSNGFSVNSIRYVGNSATPSRGVFDFNFSGTFINDNQTDSLYLNAMSGTFNIGL